MSVLYKPTAGSRVEQAVSAAIQMAAIAEETVELDFNDTVIFVHPSYARHLLTEWSGKREPV